MVDLADDDDDDDIDQKLLNGKGATKQDEEVEGLNGKSGEELLDSKTEEELLATKGEEDEELCLDNMEVLDELKEDSDSEMCLLAEIKSLAQYEQTNTAGMSMLFPYESVIKLLHS